MALMTCRAAFLEEADARLLRMAFDSATACAKYKRGFSDILRYPIPTKSA